MNPADYHRHIAKTLALLLLALMLGTMGWLKFMDGTRTELEPARLSFDFTATQASSGRVIVDSHYVVNFQYPASQTFQTINIPLPATREPATSIRIDPTLQPTRILIRNMEITRDGKTLAEINIERIYSLNPDAVVTGESEGWSVQFTGNRDFPALLLRGIYPLDMPVHNSAGFGAASLWSVWFLALLLVAGLIFHMIRSCRASGPGGVLIFSGFFLMAFGVRVITILMYGDRIPHWDYWHLPWTVYLPFASDQLTWQGMIDPVNEHRIFFTRIFSLGLFLLNGQWENLYEATAMSFMHSLTATGLALALSNAFGSRHRLSILALVFTATALPFSWENTIWANQSQFYFFVGFSILTIWLLGMHRPLTARWWFGASAALAAQFTVGSGLLAPVIITGLSLYRLLRDTSGRKDATVTLVSGILLSSIGYLFRIKSSSAGMLTKNMDQFIQTFGKTMSWPFIESAWLWILLWLPFVFFVILSLLARKRPWSRAEAWTIALGGWVLLNALGVGIFRGGFSSGPVSRYMDLTAMGLVANGLALVLLPSLLIENGRLFTWWRKGRLAWLFIMLAGVMQLTIIQLHYPAKSRLEIQRRSLETIQTFQQTGDLNTLMNKKELQLPHPSVMQLAAWLESSAMQRILPVSIRPPLPFSMDYATGFVSPGIYGAFDFDINEPTWGSYGREGDRTMGSFRSKPIPAPSFRYLAIPALGKLSCRQDKVTARFMDPENQKYYRACALRDSPGGWSTLYARVPSKPLIFDAQDRDQVFVIGFRAPRELSTLSYWSFRFIENGPLLLVSGITLLSLGFYRHEKKQRL